jgi:hypothetical protein
MMAKFGQQWHEHASPKDVLAFGAAIMLMFCVTGYLLTTVLFRSLWRGRATWSYPVIAVALFSVHFEILNLGLGGAFDPPDRVLVRTAGAAITFVCTYVGSTLLQQVDSARMAASEA